MPISRYGGITGTKKISEDFENINTAFNNVATEADTNKGTVDTHIANGNLHTSAAEKTKLAGITAGAGGVGSATDSVIGDRTLSDGTAPTGNTGSLTTLLGWLANMIKSITGKASWRTAPATTLEDAKTHMDSSDLHTSAAEHTKLAGVQAGAEVNQYAFSTVTVAGQGDVVADSKSDTLTLAGGTGITVTTDPSTDKVTITATGTATPGAHASSHITGGTDIIPDAVTGGVSGLMSGSDATFVRSTGETKTGAQNKADAAQAAAATDATTKANAAAALSIPLIQRGAVNGVATLDATTRMPAGQLPINVMMGTTADVTYYVRTDGSDTNTGLVNTAGGAFKTISKAISVFPTIVNHSITVSVAAGTYAEEVVIIGLVGKGSLLLLGAASLAAATNYKVTNLVAVRNTIRINVNGFEYTGAPPARNNSSINVSENPGFIEIAQSRSVFVDTSKAAITVVGSTVNLYVNEFTGKSYQVLASYLGKVNVQDLSGTGNTYRFVATNGGYISYFGTVSSGLDAANNGGAIISNGVIGPWGEGTTKSYVNAYKTATQSVAANVSTKIIFDSKGTDYFSEFTSSRFTAQKSGQYSINASLGVNGIADQGYVDIGIATNGVVWSWNRTATSGTLTGQTIRISDVLDIPAGTYVEILVLSTAAFTVENYPERNFVRIARV